MDNLATFIASASERIDAYWEAQRERKYPVRSNRASELGHPCERYLTYQRLHWDKAEPKPASLMRVFNEGKYQGESIKATLREMGFVIREEELNFPPNSWNIGGRIDAKIGFNEREMFVAELKSCSPFIFPKLDADYIRHPFDPKHWYLRNYYAQMQLYLFLDTTTYKDRPQEGLFVLKNKTSGEVKLVPITLDMDFADWLIERVERVNLAVAKQELLPPNINPSCNECPYKTLCLPAIESDGCLTAEQNKELDDLLTRRDALRTSRDEYNALDDAVKAMLLSYPQGILVTDTYTINIKETPRPERTQKVKEGTVRRVEFVKK